MDKVIKWTNSQTKWTSITQKWTFKELYLQELVMSQCIFDIKKEGLPTKM